MEKIKEIRNIMKYYDAILFIYYKEKDQTKMKEYLGDIKVNTNYQNSDKYTMTRCYTINQIIKLIYGYEEKNCEIKYNDEELGEEDLRSKMTEIILKTYESKDEASFEFSIDPDHVFIIVKIKNKWILISSWMMMNQINFIDIGTNVEMSEFIEKMYKFYGRTKNNNKNKYENVLEYDLFMAKYFLYKTAINKRSLFYCNELTTLKEIMKKLNKEGMITEDYFGKDRLTTKPRKNNYFYNHTMRMKYYGKGENGCEFITKFFNEMYKATKTEATEANNVTKQDVNKYIDNILINENKYDIDNIYYKILKRNIYDLYEMINKSQESSENILYVREYEIYSSIEIYLNKYNSDLKIEIKGDQEGGEHIFKKTLTIDEEYTNYKYLALYEYWDLLQEINECNEIFELKENNKECKKIELKEILIKQETKKKIYKRNDPNKIKEYDKIITKFINKIKYEKQELEEKDEEIFNNENKSENNEPKLLHDDDIDYNDMLKECKDEKKQLDWIYEIIYEHKQNENKYAYLVPQKIIYKETNSEKEKKNRMTYYLIIEETETKKLVIMNIPLYALNDILKYKYEIVKNSFYREYVNNAVIKEINIAKKKEDNGLEIKKMIEEKMLIVESNIYKTKSKNIITILKIITGLKEKENNNNINRVNVSKKYIEYMLENFIIFLQQLKNQNQNYRNNIGMIIDLIIYNLNKHNTLPLTNKLMPIYGKYVENHNDLNAFIPSFFNITQNANIIMDILTKTN
jgi:hypothetical protein